jgi:hypothetical protein
MRTVIWADLVALTVAGCAAALAATAGSGVGASTATAPEPTLVGTDWQLISYQEPGAGRRRAGPVTVASTISLTVKGTVSVPAASIRVTVRATPASAVQTLPFHAVPGSSLRIAGAWLADFRPGSSTVTFYDRAVRSSRRT